MQAKACHAIYIGLRTAVHTSLARVQKTEKYWKKYFRFSLSRAQPCSFREISMLQLTGKSEKLKTADKKIDVVE